MVGACKLKHIQQVNIDACCTYNPVHLIFALDDVVEHQGVRLSDFAVYSLVVNAVAVCVVGIIGGVAVNAVQYPSAFVHILDCGLHHKDGGHKVALVAAKTLDVLVAVGDRHIVLVGVGIDNAGFEFEELDVHRVVGADGVTLVIGTRAFHNALLVEEIDADVVG